MTMHLPTKSLDPLMASLWHTALPPEILYYILSELFSDYLHRLLVRSECLQWDPFRTLPLVSHAFHDLCHGRLFHHIFGPLEDNETMHNILDESLKYWSQANLPLTEALPVEDLSEAELKYNNSLIQIYNCAALAKSYLNLDVLWNIELEQQRMTGELSDAEDEEVNLQEEDDGDIPPIPPVRWFKMRDDNMHRLFLPLSCAIELCDQIPPELAYIVADYLAEMIPIYSTVPIILKSVQDLETYVSGEYNLGTDILADWTHQALMLAEGTSRLLMEMQKTGKLVRSFKRSSSIPLKVLTDTKILEALDKVEAMSWGEQTPSLNEYARAVKTRLQSDDEEQDS